jgi:uncharacterized protein YbgA (DUF1722 family)/uncharacterized protein YbbK (DUF523 family)
MGNKKSPEKGQLRLGISSCLLGNEVRFDGGHKRDSFSVEMLGKFVDWVPVCPEVEAGMGIPRPAMRLVDSGDGVRLVEIRSEADHTRSMEKYAAQRVRALGKLDLCGYVLKKGSPSCGMSRVKIYGAKKMPTTKGVGLYASALLGAYPSLPVEEEGRLHDARLRENFIERIFAYRRLRDLFQGRWSAAGVIEFHSRHKLQLMAHSTESYRSLGREVASIKGTPRPIFRDTYMKGFMEALAQLASRGRNANALNHAAGHLKKYLDSSSRMELAGIIDEYRQELVPLVVPITLLRHYVRQLEVDYLEGQTFLEPHPKELMLRNHV